MNIEIIAIGNEILSGHTTNTNAVFISQQLFQEGFRVSRHTVLPDEEEELHIGLKNALQRNQLVITTGGLGPTCDDVTRTVVAELFQSKFYYNEEVAADLRNRFGKQLLSLEDQATVPCKAILLKNTVGTAPGLIFKTKDHIMILLPGVPGEMKAMWENVINFLKENVPSKDGFFSKHLFLFNLSETDPDLLLRKLIPQYPQVEFGIYPAQGMVQVHLTTKASDAMRAAVILDPPYRQIREAFAQFIYETPFNRLEEAILDRFIEKKITLSAAESCTGGSFSSRLVHISGASQYFLGSVIAYSNALKTHLLGVSEQLLIDRGAVSPEVVIAMLEGLFERTNSDYGVAISGIAGPAGGTVEKPIGTIWSAVGRRGQKPHVWQTHAQGSREMIIEKGVNGLLSELLIQTR